MAKKGTKKKAAAPKPKVKKKTTITFGCVSSTCVADTGHDTKIGDTGSTVTMKAKSEKVTIQYFDPATGNPVRPPFEETAGTGPIVLSKGSPQTFTVRADAQHHNPYKLTCENPNCFGVVTPPEMIVP